MGGAIQWHRYYSLQQNPLDNYCTIVFQTQESDCFTFLPTYLLNYMQLTYIIHVARLAALSIESMKKTV